MTQTIVFTAEPHRNAAWTVAALIGKRVVAFVQFDDAPKTKNELWAVRNELAARPDMVAAQEAFFAMDDDATDDEIDAACPSVVFGMVSGGHFTFNLSKGDMARAGVKHLA